MSYIDNLVETVLNPVDGSEHRVVGVGKVNTRRNLSKKVDEIGLRLDEPDDCTPG